MSAAARLSVAGGLAGRLPGLPGGSLPWLAAVRMRALQRLEESGLPREREERWKYTSPQALLKSDYALEAEPRDLPADLAERVRLPGLDGPRLVFVNGRYHPGLSLFTELPPGLSLQPLSQSICEQAPLVETFMARQFQGSAEGFATLNTAAAAEGVLLHLAAGVRLERPIHLVFLGTPAERDLLVNLRLLIALEAGAEARLVEHSLGLDQQSHFGNRVLQVRLGEAATLRHLRLQDEAKSARLVQRSEAQLAARSLWRRYDVDLGGGLVRHDLVARLEGQGARLEAFGVFALQEQQHVDTQLYVDHVSPGTSSSTRWRGVADGRARGVFDGHIRVRSGADGAVAHLKSNNLLLSGRAVIHAKPVLEINTDEVEASHGATVGQLDERALFYLQSRGIGRAEARALLTFAFCRELFDQMSHPALRAHLGEMLIGHLPSQAAREET